MMENGNTSFFGLGIAPQLAETLLKLKFKTPTPIQHKLIPSAIEGKDVIGIAQTGTGKTMAFGIPLIQRLASEKGRGLILVPTRELALQVEESLMKIARVFGIKTVSLIGGDSIGKQIRALDQRPRILIATPGRFNDLIERRKVNLSDIVILVLDEADRMLDMGFAPQVNQIVRMLPTKRQTMFFSATMPPSIVDMTSKYMQTPVQVEVAPQGTTATGITHELFIVRRENKPDLLAKLLAQYRGSILIFCRTKSGTSRVARSVSDLGHRAAPIHSDRSLEQRRKALEGFRRGQYRILVATDIAARGIDVSGIELVINYDLPDDPENYVHRIGRTGRAGLTGHAISFAAPEQRTDVLRIEKITNTVLPVSQREDIPQEKFDKPYRAYSFSRQAQQRRSRAPFRRR